MFVFIVCCILCRANFKMRDRERQRNGEREKAMMREFRKKKKLDLNGKRENYDKSDVFGVFVVFMSCLGLFVRMK